jgi:pSer/pThr/pTyr-binding forkhead associated (FHA) protein
MARLRITNGPLAGQTVEVTDEIVIGRENADLEIDDAEISRRHAAVRRLERTLEVEDLGSSNGTFVDGKQIDAPTPVGGGAEIKLGRTVLTVEGVLPVDATQLRAAPGAIADPQATRARDVPADVMEATNARRVSDRTLAAAAQEGGGVNAAHAEASASALSATAPAGGEAALDVGAFAPPTHRRRRGLASRSWLPPLLSFGTVVLVAVALVIYFAAR